MTIDTLRADHLAFYGYARETTPNLSAWVDEAAVFEQVYTPLPLTDPALSSLMTGIHPIHHGVRHIGRRLPPRFTTLAQVLEGQGYLTAAFVSRNAIVADGNLDRGFDVADFQGGHAPDLPPLQANAETWQRRAEDVTDAALAWLEGAPDEQPLFLWLHYFDPHAYYDPPEPFRDRFAVNAPEISGSHLKVWWGPVGDLGQVHARYDEEILTADHHLDRVVRTLRERGIWDETLFVLTADHGESLGEHGYMDHGEWLYQEQVRVPLLMRKPGIIPAGLRHASPVRLIDVAPTIVEVLGLQGPTVGSFVREMDGASFAPAFAGEALGPRRVFFESENCPNAVGPFMAPFMICHPAGPEGKIRAVFDGRYKLIVTPRREGRVRELYDVMNDPAEENDLSTAEPERVAALEAELDAFWAAPSAPAQKVAPEVMKQLEALGYTG